MDKYIKDGKVAVIISPEYGAGWYTWNGDRNTLFDPDIVSAILANQSPEQIAELIQRKYGHEYFYTGDPLVVVWVDEGEHFIIDEYDGSETLVLANDLERSYITA